MTPPLVSAIVVNWNGGPMLLDALGSLVAQTWPTLEVILVDNGSSDGSVEEARRRFGDKLLIIRNAKNEGFARGNNIGFDAARGDWIFLLNSDAVCDSHAVAELMRFVADYQRAHNEAASGNLGKPRVVVARRLSRPACC